MRIFIIDGEPIVLLILKNFLSELGHEVLSFEVGSELLSNEGSLAPPEVVIADVSSLNGNCLAVLDKIKECYPKAGVVMTLSQNSPLATRDAVEHNIFGYLHKPIRLGELELMLLRYSEANSITTSEYPDKN